jgi:hypothetical protein
MIRRTTLYCQLADNERTWLNFAPHPQVTRMYDAKRPVYEVAVEEAAPDSDDYWGWWDNERGAFQFVYVERGMVEMC